MHAMGDLSDVVGLADEDSAFRSDGNWDAEDDPSIMEHAQLVLHHDKSRARQDEFRVHEDMLRM